MKFRLVYTDRAVKDIRKLDRRVRERIGDALRHFSEDPLGNSRRLVNSDIGTYRYRVGDYRVVLTLNAMTPWFCGLAIGKISIRESSMCFQENESALPLKSNGK